MLIAPVGQASRHLPHPRHRLVSTHASPSMMVIAPALQTRTHSPQPLHFSGSTHATILSPAVATVPIPHSVSQRRLLCVSSLPPTGPSRQPLLHHPALAGLVGRYDKPPPLAKLASCGRTAWACTPTFPVSCARSRAHALCAERSPAAPSAPVVPRLGSRVLPSTTAVLPGQRDGDCCICQMHPPVAVRQHIQLSAPQCRILRSRTGWPLRAIMRPRSGLVRTGPFQA